MNELYVKLFNFVIYMTKKFNIDESHGLVHSLDVLNYACEIYNSEVILNSELIKYKKIIFISAILHDVCDKKYMNEEEGIKLIEDFLNEKIDNDEIKQIIIIISTMSYSKVIKNGFPVLENKEFQLAYHIVREADLLAAFNFDRVMIYTMVKLEKNILDSFNEGYLLFKNRVFKHKKNNFYITNYSKKKDSILKKHAKNKIKNWKNLLI